MDDRIDEGSPPFYSPMVRVCCAECCPFFLPPCVIRSLRGPLCASGLSYTRVVYTRWVPPILPGWYIRLLPFHATRVVYTPPSHAIRVVYVGIPPMYPGGICRYPSYVPGCIYGGYTSLLCYPGGYGGYTSLLCLLPYTPWVYHHPTVHTHHRPAPSSNTDVQRERALGSVRE